MSSFLAFASLAGAPVMQSGTGLMLMQHPTVNADSIVFSFAGDLWKVNRTGGDAVRLTSSIGNESLPYFSPDGKTIAFSGEYDGNTDVYTIPATGGIPKRLTYHPGGEVVTGWTPDGSAITFASMQQSTIDLPRLFTVNTKGGVPTALPFPSGSMMSFSPDGSQLAYVAGVKWQDAWKRYRGGQAYAIWVGRMSDSKVYEIPRKGWNDEQPMWVGDKIYYLSDHKGIVGLQSYDVNTKRVTEEVPGAGFDIKSATAGPDVIVYEKLGSLHLFDPKTKQSTPVEVTIRADFPEVRPAFKSLQGNLSGASISPSGQRIVTSARGWVFTVPAEKGDARAVSEQQGVHRRDPSWSPDGKWISYITDQNGRQQMAIYDTQAGTERLIDLGQSPGYYYGAGPSPWSPDSTKLGYTDHRNQLWILDVASGKSTLVDQTIYTDPNVQLAARWSPDSKWITYARDLASHMQAIFVYSLESGKATQITDGLAHARGPVFDRDGKHLYFFASTNMGASLSWLDMSSLTMPVNSSNVYCVVLRNDLPNPLHPESDEEIVKSGEPPAAPAAPAKFNIDLPGIEDRIITLPMPNADYTYLEPGTPGTFFAFVMPPRVNPFAGSPAMTISKFSMAERKASPFGAGSGMVTTPDGSKALINMMGTLAIIPTAMPTPPGTGAVDLSGMRMRIDPREEWKSIFHEIWRNEPMLFYAANLHGINAEEMRRRYEPFLDNIMTRSDLNYLFTDMLGEISIGHMWASGGDMPSGIPGVPGGLLGADFSFENGKYRLTRVFNGERWNPGLYAPLAQPGVNAKAGEYILAIDGKELADSNDIYQMLEGKAGRQVKVKIGSSPSGAGAREVTVVPVANEMNLRLIAWVEDNRRYVAQATNGRAGYVHVPDTGLGGWNAFRRYYYAQVDKDGVIIDERFNHGGLINDYMVHEMTKTLDAVFTPRTGRDWPTPGNAIYGPKVMIANQFAGSGGDMFPWLFKYRKIGPIVGKRTWGGLVASFGFPTVDGGNINSPNVAFYNPHSNKWEVEGHGVDPDIEVELDPYLWRQGKDAQLERAIEEINKMLKNYKPKVLQRPANPDKSKVGSGGF